jgi:hypothetical protein
MTDTPKNLETLREEYEYVTWFGPVMPTERNAAHDAYIAAVREEAWRRVEPMLEGYHHAKAKYDLANTTGHEPWIARATEELDAALSAIKAAILGGGE